MNLISLLKDKKVIVTVGAGGVGKTTLAATIGLCYVLRGLNVMVITIDPARRLAKALGLKKIGGQTHRIDISSLKTNTKGIFDVMMLDSAAVFRSLIKTYITSTEHQERILNNKFFMRFSEAMTGTQEHAAIEKLYELVSQKQYDIIVLDTPPSRYALEFLNSPTRLLNVLDDTVLKWLIAPTAKGLSMISFGSKYISKMLSLFAGTEMLQDLTEFITLMAGQLGGFRDRAESVNTLLKDHNTAYVAIGSPDRHAIEGALMFHRAFTKDKYNLSAFVINKILQVPEQPITRDLFERTLRKYYPDISFPHNFSKRAFDSYIHRVNVSRIHKLKAEQLIAMTELQYPVFYLPAMIEDIVNLSGIYNFAKLLSHQSDQRKSIKVE